MRQNPHVRICGGLGSATTLVYPTTFIRDDRSPRWHEKGADNDAGGRVDRPDERVIWSPFRLQRRRRN